MVRSWMLNVLAALGEIILRQQLIVKRSLVVLDCNDYIQLHKGK